jgi:AcrR family transcriptional regulator
MEAKHRILEKAHEWFNRFGIRSVSMDDIATQVGMSKKTLYQYYTDKDELVDAVFSAVMEDHKTCCTHDRSQAGNAIEEVFMAFDRVQSHVCQHEPCRTF